MVMYQPAKLELGVKAYEGSIPSLSFTFKQKGINMRILIPGLPGSEPLSQIAREVTSDEFGDDLGAYTSELLTTMYKYNGVGLAAPQVGDSRRIIVIDTGHVGQHTPESSYDGGYAANALVLINPIILETSGQPLEAEEGCLSLPKLGVKVSRSDDILVRYQNNNGDFIEQRFVGFVATIVQHEIDHLNGITLLKYASRLKRKLFLNKMSKLNRKIKESQNGKR